MYDISLTIARLAISKWNVFVMFRSTTPENEKNVVQAHDKLYDKV